MLSPLLFIIYLLPICEIIRRHGLFFHSYVDDIQLYISTEPSYHLPPQSLTNCLLEIKTWMTTNLLKLHSNKTELMVVAPKALLKKVGDLLLTIDGSTITPSPLVRNLGIILDSTLSFQNHIKSVAKSAFFHLRNISRLRPSLSNSIVEKLIHCFITSRLDYCNGVPTEFPAKLWTGFSTFRTLLPECSPAPRPGSTSPPLSGNSTGSRSSHASLTNSSSSPTNPSMHCPHSTSKISSTLTSHPALSNPQAPACSPFSVHASSPLGSVPSVSLPPPSGTPSLLKFTTLLLWTTSSQP